MHFDDCHNMLFTFHELICKNSTKKKKKWAAAA